MLDMLRSHISGERLLPSTTANYVAVGVIIAGGIAGFGIVAASIAELLLDVPVVIAVIAALGGEIQQYVDWRAVRDPSYKAIKQELYGASSA